MLAVTTRKRSKEIATETDTGTTGTEQPEPSAKRAHSKASATDTDEVPDITSRIAAAYTADPTFTEEQRNKQWTLHDDLWWDDGQILVPDVKEVKHLIFPEFLDASYAGHLGIRKTV